MPNAVRAYPYGLSGIGLLVQSGVAQSMPNERSFLGRNSRTAVAWTNDRQHFFLIVARRYVPNPNWRRGMPQGYLYLDNEGWTWDDTTNFFITELPRWMQNDLPNWMRHFRNELLNARVLSDQQEARALFPDVGVSIQIDVAFMLDGGGSSQISWRWVRAGGRRCAERHYQEPNPIQRREQIVGWTYRRVPTIVGVRANAP